jgi:2-methylcitrate dehydratase PrpD
MKTISERYAEFITRTRFEDLGPEVVEQAKKLILDLLGVSFGGYAMAFPKMVVDFVLDLGGKPEATVIQTKRKVPAVNAALANASCAHALDMDDGHRFAAAHPGAVIIPASIAAAELVGGSTKTLITGIVAGYEVMIRIGRAINPSSLNRGFHITGITGTFGAAASVALIMGLDPGETVAALGMAGLQSAGLIQVNHEEEGSMVKPITPARAAVSGLLSCILARKGARGPLQLFEGEDGYLKAFTDETKTELLTQELGRDYEVLNVYLKLYSACRHAHAPIDAALEAFKKGDQTIEAIERIVVETYPAAVRLAGIPHATTPSAGRFSIAFSVALALVKQEAGADQYCEKNLRDETIQALAAKVELRSSPKWEKVYPQKRGATVTLLSKEGKSSTMEVNLAKGEPENPASWKEIREKFRRNATLVLSGPDAERVEQVVSTLETGALEDLTGLM